MRVQETYKSFAQTISTTATLPADPQSQGKMLSLEEENQKLKAQLQVFTEIQLENEALTKLKTCALSGCTVNIPAQHHWARFVHGPLLLFVDKGENQNATKLAGVITPEGVVG